MIVSFKCKETEKIWRREASKKLKLPGHVMQQAYDKLLLINAAEKLFDLANPPGNRLEALKGNRKGQFSIRVNKQWRICFKFEQGNVHEVEIVDYH